MLGALVFATSPALAANPECPKDTGNAAEMEQKGRALFEEALKREAADPRAALEILSCVQRFADKPAVSLRIGIIAERLGNRRLAVTSFERYLALAGDAAPDRVEMQQHIDQLRSQLGEAQPPPTPPPSEPERPPPEAPREEAKSQTPGWIVAGAGAAIMAVGAALLVSAKNRNDDVHAIEPGTTYWNSASARDELETAKREQLFGIIGLAAGAATTALGVWWIVDSSSGASARASAGPGTARVDFRVAF